MPHSASSSSPDEAGIEMQTAPRHRYNYGNNPLARERTNDTDASYVQAFGGAFQPAPYKIVKGSNIANPAPLGLAGFAFTTFLLSLINLNTRGVATPSIVVGPAYAYGGLMQLLAGMW